MRRSFIWPVALVLAVAVTAAACSSTSSSSSSSSAAAAKAPSLKGKPIVIGAVGSFTGPGSGSTALAKPVLQAWEDYTNAHGGINGHPVKLYIMNDQNTPATAIANVDQLVNQDHVVAILDVGDDLESNYATFLQQHNVPLIGDAETPLFGSNPDLYSTGTTIEALVYGEIDAAKLGGANKLGLLYCAEIATCASAIPLNTALGKPLGVKVVYTSAISSTAPSYTAPCLAAKAAGANGLQVTAASTTVVNVAEGCYAQGYKPIWDTTAGEITTSWLSIPAFDNTVGNVQDVPWFDSSIPATKTMQSAINRYEPGTTTNAAFGEAAILGWVAGMVFEAAATAGHIGPTSTSADVVTALGTIHNDTFGGLTPPITYTTGKPTIVPCSFIVGIRKGHYTEPQGLKTVCMPAA